MGVASIRNSLPSSNVYHCNQAQRAKEKQEVEELIDGEAAEPGGEEKQPREGEASTPAPQAVQKSDDRAGQPIYYRQLSPPHVFCKRE